MKDLNDKTTFQPKSLFLTSQETLTKNLDALYEIGAVPYEFIEHSLRHATPEQLQRIEKCNPKIKRESNELWLAHCLLFPDVKDEYNKMGLHRDPKKWRGLYRRRYEENELKKESVKQKIREKYNIINNEKAAKSIKVIKGVLPMRKRAYEDTRRTNVSLLFQKSRKETSKVASIYNTNQRRTGSSYSIPTSRPMPRATPSRQSTTTATANNNNNNNNNTLTIARPNVTKTAKIQSAQLQNVTRPSITATRSTISASRPMPRPKLNRLANHISTPITVSQNETKQHQVVVTKPVISRPTQYLRTLPIPSTKQSSLPQPRHLQAPTPPSSTLQYKINPDRYSQPYNSPISPPFSPPRSNSPEARPQKKQKMHL